jgi:ABC-2 type transport system permease protein
MKTSKISLQDHLRIILTITAKDIGDAIKNKTTITVIISALFMVVLYRLLPILTGSFDAPELIVADPGGSALVEKLADSQAFYVVVRPDEQAMLKRASVSETANLALLIPPGFDQMLADGRAPELQGYTLYWVKPARAAELRQAAEAELSRLAGQSVRITTNLTPIHPTQGDNSLANWAAFAMVFALLMINFQLIPNLMLEEKQTHTLDALLVSPASAWDLAAGKALTGLFYSILVAAVILAFYSGQVLQWGLMTLAVLLGIGFLAPLGLFVGQKVESRAQLGVWAYLLIIPLIAPALIILIAELFPAIVVKIARLFPTGALLSLVMSSFSQAIAPGNALLDIGIMLAWTVPLVGLLVWSIRRMDRAGSARPGVIPPATAARRATVQIEGENAASQEPDRPLSLPEISGLEAVSSLSAGQASRPGGLRIILTIASKDLRESIRNRVALLIILTSLMMILLNSALPLLLRSRIKPTVMIYDAGRSEAVRTLMKGDDLPISLTRTQQELEADLGGFPQTHLGLSLPADFDQRLAAGETVDLDSFLVHWADRKIAAQLANEFSAAVARLSPGAVDIASQATIVYPATEGFGQSLMVAQIMAFVLLIVGLSLVPILLVEEKETHTLDALMVSPARSGQVTAGKALVGFIYGFLAAAVVVLLNLYLFANWGVLLLAVLAGMSFAVALGLLIGAVSNNPSTIGLWGGMALLLLIATGLLSLLSNANWPAWLRELLYWLPSGALIRLIRLAMLEAPQPWIVLGSAGLLFGLALVIYILADLRLRRMVG